MLIEVTQIHPAPIGKKMATIVDAAGLKFGLWPEKLKSIKVGRTYEAEVTEDGRFRKIEKIVPASTPAPAAASVAAQASPTGEAEYVGRVLAALITSGGVDKTQIATATEWLRKVWRDSEPRSAEA